MNPFGRSKRTRQNRPIFGFPCDRLLSEAIRALARAWGVPIFALAEHLLHLGFILMNSDLKGHADEEEADNEPLERLKKHLRAHHSLVPELGSVTVEEEFLAGVRQARRGREDLMGAVDQIVLDLEKLGLVREEILEGLEQSVRAHAEQRERERLLWEFHRDIDAGPLQRVHRRFPNFLPMTFNLVDKYGTKALREMLGLKD